MQSDGQVLRIIGVLEHIPECEDAVQLHYPYIPIHPHVMEVALHQLAGGSR